MSKIVALKVPPSWHTALSWLADRDGPRGSISKIVGRLIEAELRARRPELPPELQRKLDGGAPVRRRPGYRTPVRLGAELGTVVPVPAADPPPRRTPVKRLTRDRG